MSPFVHFIIQWRVTCRHLSATLPANPWTSSAKFLAHLEFVDYNNNRSRPKPEGW
jgi:hypothetical protein